MRVLVVDDEAIIRELVADELRNGGIEVVEAENGDEALVRLEDNRFDVIFTDVAMPGSIDGLELAARARKAWPQTRVVLTSGYIGPRLKEDIGAFLPKPFPPLDALALVLAMRQQP